MWPWAHWAVGYLAVSGLRRRRGERPDAATTVAVSIATLFPDLVDKPLAWWVGVLPNGRSLAHSAITLGVVLALLVLLVGRSRRPRPAVAVGLGWASHLLADALYPLAGGRFDELAFLLWPALPPVQYRLEGSLAAHAATLSLSPRLLFEAGLFVVAVVVWWRDGAPGVPWPTTGDAQADSRS